MQEITVENMESMVGQEVAAKFLEVDEVKGNPDSIGQTYKPEKSMTASAAAACQAE